MTASLLVRHVAQRMDECQLDPPAPEALDLAVVALGDEGLDRRARGLRDGPGEGVARFLERGGVESRSKGKSERCLCRRAGGQHPTVERADDEDRACTNGTGHTLLAIRVPARS